MVNNQLLVIDEISMLEKALLCKLLDSAIVTQNEASVENSDLPFGGMNMLLSGDFHQFPPVARVHGALFDPEHSSDLSAITL